MRLIPFEPKHLGAFQAQEAQRESMEWMRPEIAEAAAQAFSFTGLDDRGFVVGCAGLAPFDEGLVAWAVFGDAIADHPLALMRAVKRGLDLHRRHTVIAHIDPDHTKAAAFARALSFQFKEVRADLHPSGRALHVYVREGVNG